MLGGLSRWLRAAGYDSYYEYGIDDGKLVRKAQQEGCFLLSSDGPIFERNIIKDGTIKALFIPRQSSKLEQLKYVVKQLKLPLRPPRCMACGGKLLEIPKHSVIDEVPPLAFKSCEQFWRCKRCGKLFWHGTHWRRITKRLNEVRN